MAVVEGTHKQAGSGREIAYRAEYEAERNAIHFKALFDARTRREGQFDFDPSKVDADAAVDAFMQNLIAKGDWDVAP